VYDDYVPSPEATWTQRVMRHLGADRQQPALVEATPSGTATWTRAQLGTMVAGALELFDELLVPAHAMVPALLTTRPASVAVLIAGALSDRPLAPLAPRMTRSELVGCVADIPGEVLLAEPESVDLATDVASATGKRVVLVGSDLAGTAPLLPRSDPDAVALVMHTSGTTGRPKRVAAREFALGRRSDVNGYLLDIRPRDRVVTTSLFHHVGGLGNIAVALGNGAAVVLFPRFSVAAWRMLENVAPTQAVTIPSVFEMLLAEDALHSSTIRRLAYGGAPIHPQTMQRVQQVMPDVEFVNLFGQTEGSPVATLDPAGHRAAVSGQEHLLESVGRPAPGTELVIHDPDADGVGEVWARAPHSFLVDDEGWQHTGDIGRIVDGYLYLVGRRGDKIIRGGENVYPLEVEQVLALHPDVRDVIVVGVPDQRLGETIKAFIVPTGLAPDPEALRAFARERLAGFKVPVEWEFLSEMPRNANGKILRRELAAAERLS
jgi:acyl-CoA synthetase (AMP-forming)/AMP-acid ligase II